MAISTPEAPAPHDPEHRDRLEQPKKRGWKFWTAIGAVPTAAVAAGTFLVANNGEDTVAAEKPAATSTPNPGQETPSAAPTTEAPSPSPTDLPTVTKTPEATATAGGEFNAETSTLQEFRALGGLEQGDVALGLIQKYGPDAGAGGRIDKDGNIDMSMYENGLRTQTKDDSMKQIVDGLVFAELTSMYVDNKEVAKMIFDSTLVHYPNETTSLETNGMEYIETGKGRLDDYANKTFDVLPEGPVYEAECQFIPDTKCYVSAAKDGVGRPIAVAVAPFETQTGAIRWSYVELADSFDEFKHVGYQQMHEVSGR